MSYEPAKKHRNVLKHVCGPSDNALNAEITEESGIFSWNGFFYLSGSCNL